MTLVRLKSPAAWAAAMCLFAASAAGGVELNWSGFATLGYARSNSDYTYLGSINRDGTFRTDSLVAGQLDLRLNPEWSATVQAQIAPAANHDDRWSAKASWAFVAWRPDNDWLVRAGKARVPLYLYSESQDIGVATDMVRPPAEQYSIAPTTDFTGLFATRNLPLRERDLSIDAYAGQATAHQRIWYRDGIPGLSPAGAYYQAMDVKVGGLVLTLRDPSFTWRLGAHSARTRRSDGQPLPVSYPRVDVAPGIGYWQVDSSLPGPGVSYTARIRNLIVTTGADWHLPAGWRLIGEYLRIDQRDTDIGSEGHAGYVALAKRIGAVTPYVSWARQRSSDHLLQWRRDLITPGMPAAIPGADMINAAQRVAGESMIVFDQSSVAIGASYALSPTAKLKGEWMRTRLGQPSIHLDTPPGQPDPQGLRVNTLSVNVSVAF